MSWVSSLFSGSGGYNNPADAAMPYLEQVPSYVDQYYSPYINNGLTAGQQNASQYGKMATNPADYYNDIYSTYEPSDYYQYTSDQMAKTASNTAAAGGYAGTESDIQKQTEQQNALLNMDWNQYLDQVLGIQNTGLAGNQSLYNTGYQASNMSAEDLIGMLNAQAGLAYKGTEGENAYNNASSNALLNLLGQTAGTAAGIYFK